MSCIWSALRLKLLVLAFVVMVSTVSLSVVGYCADDDPWRPLFRILAEQGDVNAQYRLGNMYALGKGGPIDNQEALKWYLKAAEQGHADAQNNLGAMYGNGRGVPVNYQEAVKWYLKAAEQGEAFAQNNLGAMYGNGRGVPVNYQEAMKWYLKAAEQGIAEAQYNLGAMYANGMGAPKNYIKAYVWWSLASAQMNENAMKYMEILTKEMTPEQIAEAQKEAAVLWKKIQENQDKE